MTVLVALAAVGAALIAAGVACWSPPAALVTAGGELVTAAYIGAYLKGRVV